MPPCLLVRGTSRRWHKLGDAEDGDVAVRPCTGSQERLLVPAGRRTGARHTRSHRFPQVEARRPTALSEDPAPLAGGHPTVRLCPAWPLATSISRSRGANVGDPIRRTEGHR